MKIILNKDKIILKDQEVFNSGSVNYYEIPIEHDEQWNELSIEAVIIKEKEEKGIGTAVINNKIYIDRAFKGKYLIGFKGFIVEYNLTTDSVINPNKIYYIRSGEEGAYVYTKVSNPILAEISTYYEAIKSYQISTKLQPIIFLKGAGEVELTNDKEIPTPTEWEIYLSQVQEFIDNGNEILSEAEEKIEDMAEALEDVDAAIEQTNNLDIDIDKVDKTATVTLTKKDGTEKTVEIDDGLSLQFMWQGTYLGIKTEEQEEYTFVNLQGVQGVPGPQGEPFKIKKTYPSVEAMNADFNNMEFGDYVMIASTVEVEDNAKLYTRGEIQWVYITDFSGATGIQGPTGATPNIQIGTVTQGDTPSVTRSGTDENPVLNFVLVKGDKGDTGNTGATGNGISSVAKTSTSGLIDTYTITFTNGTTTTFNVTNGNGIASITKTATVGSVDTYTITFTNGTTTTFEVTNGEVTQEQLNEVIEQYNRLLNQIPTDTPLESDNIYINDSGDLPLENFALKGKTEQNTTTGKNKLNTSLQDMKTYNANGTWNNNVYTYAGITITVNDDLSIILNGTCTQQNTFLLSNNKLLEAGTYILNGINSPNEEARIYIWDSSWGNITNTLNSTEFTLNADTQLKVGINIYNGKTYNNFVIKPMIRLASVTDDSYEPYTNGPTPRPGFPQEIVNVEAKNLLSVPDFTETTIQGINVSASNQQLKINGTGTSGNYPWIIITKGGIYLKNGTPTSSEIINWANGTISEGIVSKSKEIISGSSDFNIEIDLYDETGATISSFTSSTKVVAMALYLGNNKTYTNYTIGLQIEKGTSVTKYVPYNCIQIKKCNKNLFDGELELGIISGSTGLNVSNNSNIRCKNYIPVNELTNYRITSPDLSGAILVYEYKEDYSYNLSTNKAITQNETLTTNSGTKYIRFRPNTSTTNTSVRYIIEKGSTATDYIAHQGKTYNFPLSQGQKLMEGDYLAEDGIHHVKGQVVLDGTEPWTNKNITDNNLLFSTSKIDHIFNVNNLSPISNYFKNEDYLWSTDVEGIRLFDLIYALRIRINKELLSDISSPENAISSLKTWLSTHNVTVEYELAEETVEQYTSAQQAVYDEIIHDGTYEGVTNYNTIANINPNMNIEYHKSLKIILSNLDNRLSLLE